MEEIWKDIEGYEGLYQVSNLGKVKSLSNNLAKKEKILKNSKNVKGYHKVTLCLFGKRKSITVHRLVAEAFIHNDKNKSQVNHINGVKIDNNVNNLEWSTASENVRHSWKNGLSNISEFCKQRVSESKSIPVVSNLTGIVYKSIRQASEIYCIPEASLADMLRGRMKNKTDLVYL
jgi:hypothetical protein